MKAILFPDRDVVTYTDLADPTAREGDVVIAVRSSGICHTDFEVLHANYGTSAFPVVPGHEYAGVVAEIGPGVADLSIGDRVVVDPNIECGDCRACKRGWAHLCERLEAYGVTRNGGFAEFSAVRGDAVHKIGDMPFEMAALAEPMGCAMNGLDAARAEVAQSALIFGAGPMGILLGVGLRFRGVTDVCFIDINDARLEFAAGLGFDAHSAESSELVQRKHGTDLVIDATGVPSIAEQLVDYTANGGTALFFGVCPSEARIQVSPFEVFRRQITLAGSHSLNHNIPEALDAVRSFDGDLSALVSHRLPLDEVARILAEQPPRMSMKVQAFLR